MIEILVSGPFRHHTTSTPQPSTHQQPFIQQQECIRAAPRRGRYWEIHPRRPRGFPRPERFPKGVDFAPLALGKYLGPRGMYFPIPPEFWWSTDILLLINSSTGMDQKIHTCGQGRIDSVKINPSLLRMREWEMHSLHSQNPSGLEKSLGRRGWISQHLPRFGGARIQYIKNQHVKKNEF